MPQPPPPLGRVPYANEITEECDQLFTSVGCSYTVAAILEFFEMETTEDKPVCIMPPYSVVSGHGDKKAYFNHVMDKFVEEYLLPTTTNDDELMSDEQTDLVKEYSLCLLRYYFLFISILKTLLEKEMVNELQPYIKSFYIISRVIPVTMLMQ
jgi:hypothetical protein